MCSFSIHMYVIAFWLGSLAVNSFGQLLMTRQWPLHKGDNYSLTCVGDYNDAALVWNDDLRDPLITSVIPRFASPNPVSCGSTEACDIGYQALGHWRSVNSADDPMEPVFDSRWEDFTQYFFSSADNKYKHVRAVPRSGTVVFSARSLATINLRLCKYEIPCDKRYFHISIAAGPNKTSKIGYFDQSGNASYQLSQESCISYQGACTKHRPSIIDASEWRTFTLTWNEELKRIQVSGDGGFILEKKFSGWMTVCHLFVQSDNSGRVKFHFYDYLVTRQTGTELTSNEIHPATPGSFCVTMLVSLCPHCKLTFKVEEYYGKNSKKIIDNFNADYSTNAELPQWRTFQRTIDLKTSNTWYIKLRVVAELQQIGAKGRWAIDRIRQCQSIDRRSSTIDIIPSWNLTLPLLPTVKCQQLSDIQSSTISSDMKIISNNILTPPPTCRPGRAGPGCRIACPPPYSCEGLSICNPSSCTCANASYNGETCSSRECPPGYRGLNCQKRCGWCKTAGLCDKISGTCRDGCSAYYIPPFCKTKLAAPIVTNVTANKVTLTYIGSHTGIGGSLTFHIMSKNEDWQSFRMFSTHFRNGTISYQPTVTGLPLSNSQYSVFTRLTTSQFVVDSPIETFTTMCDDTRLNKFRTLNVVNKGNGIVDVTLDSTEKLNPYDATKEIDLDIKLVNTTLRNDTVVKLPNSTRLRIGPNGNKFHLWTATTYHFSVQVKDASGCGKLINKDHRIPASLGFAGNKNLEVNRTETLMKLKLPPIANDTQNSVLSVIVKGSTTCNSSCILVPDNLKNLVNMTYSKRCWIAKTFANQSSRPEYFTIGENQNDEGANNCRLLPEETYVVLVVVVDETDGGDSAVIASLPIPPAVQKMLPIKLHETSIFIWLLIPLILAICFIVIFIWRRNIINTVRRVYRQHTVAWTQNLSVIVKLPTVCTTSQQQPLPAVSDDVELTDIVSKPEIVSSKRYSNSVAIKEFECYVKDCITNGQLKAQFKMLPKGLIKSSKCGSLPENKSKNRYHNVIPYDSTRVILKKLPDNPFSDYINASYVQGVGKKKAYIAAQGPKSHTVVDFWRMVWQEQAPVICMLANIIESGKLKCVQYWPEFGASKTYGEITVVTQEQQVFADFTFRTFQVTYLEETRKIEQLHYTGWPDHTVPLHPHSLITFIRKLQLTVPVIEQGPIVVHCSAGVGRTGTIILCDICLRRAISKGVVNVPEEFKKLRDCRPNMVDNDQQYIFAHLVLTECLISLPTDLPCNNELPQAIEKLKKGLPQHIERLRNTAWKDQALRSQGSSQSALPQQLKKNRFPELAPVNSDLVHLRRYPTRDNDSDYICAVIVDGLRVRKQYLASQLPLPSTFSDIWRLLAEQRIELVVILQQPDPNDPTCCDIVPEGKTFKPVPFIKVESRARTDAEKSPRIDDLVLTDTSRKPHRTQQVTVLTCLEWGLGRNGKPPPPSKLVELWIASENIHREEGPTLVLCHDGLTGCGLYLTMSFLLERMAVERECDIIFAVRAIRRSRTDFVQSQEQFEYLYDAAATYIESFETYANFA